MENSLSTPANEAIRADVYTLAPGTDATWVEFVRQHVEALRFGSVQITVNDSQVTELAVAEKTNFRVRKLNRPNTGRAH